MIFVFLVRRFPVLKLKIRDISFKSSYASGLIFAYLFLYLSPISMYVSEVR